MVPVSENRSVVVFVASWQFIDVLDYIWRPGQNPEIANGGPCREAQARQAFLQAGWDGDGELGVIWLPPFMFRDADTFGHVLWHVKQYAKGLSWLCASEPLDFPGFHDISDVLPWRRITVQATT